ncbi:MAG: TolC family protein [Sulfurihydrogenibium sp.]|uniref:TolC family protein n=1 Tax=Sulfurihydrogenibium sp. TaxID=2053621 RepID=UPI003D0DDDF6
MKKYVLGFLIYSSFTFGQTLTFEEGLNTFINNNYDILVQKNEIEKAKADIITAKLRPNPVFTANFTYYNIRNFSDRSNTQNSFRIDQEIETANKRSIRIKLAEKLLQYTQLNFKSSLKDYINTYLSAYTQLLYDKLQLENSKKNLEDFQKVLEIAKIQYEKGFLPALDYEKLKLSLIDYQKDYYSNLESYNKDKEYLKFLIKSDFDDINSESLFSYNQQFEDIDSLIEKAIEKRYDVKSSKVNVEASQLQVDLNKAMAIPNVTVGLEFDGVAEKYQFLGVGFSVPIPIFDRNQGEILKSKINLIQSKILYEKTIEQAKTEIRQLYYSLKSKESIMNEYKSKYEDVKKLKENTEKAFALRGINVLTLLDTYKLFREFQKSYTQAKIDYYTVLYQLKLATGDY